MVPRIEELLFIRDEEGIVMSDNFSEGEGLEEKTNNNILFLSLVAQLGGHISKQVVGWFRAGYNVLSGLNSSDYKGFSMHMMLEENEVKNRALSFFKRMQLGFESVFANEQRLICLRYLIYYLKV